MPNCQVVFDVASLEEVEAVYRQQLALNPGDAATRVRLAWCLLMRALHRAGQESVLAELMSFMKEALPGATGPPSPLHNPDTHRLIQDCLQQAYAVSQLSGDPASVAEVEKIQSLVRLFGGDDVISQAETNAVQILFELTQDIKSVGRNTRRVRYYP